MREEIKDKKITQNEWGNIMAPLGLDLEAVYNSLIEDVSKILRKASREGWTREKIERKIGELL